MEKNDVVVFLDTGFLLAVKSEDDVNHQSAQALMHVC